MVGKLLSFCDDLFSIAEGTLSGVDLLITEDSWMLFSGWNSEIRGISKVIVASITKHS